MLVLAQGFCGSAFAGSGVPTHVKVLAEAGWSLVRKSKKEGEHALPFLAVLAEDVGFEPTEPLGSTVFKTAAFNHSANPPDM